MTEIVDAEAREVASLPAPTALAIAARETSDAAVWTPRMVISIEDAIHNIDIRREFMHKVLEKVEGAILSIPGVTDRPGAKKALGKPGAEALLAAFGLKSACSDEDPPDLDFTGEAHGGEPFFRYRRVCRIFWGGDERTGVCVAQMSGSCNSWESKYRYRNADRVCASCGKPTIRASKPPRTGFYCWSKIGGCGLQFAADNPAITGQETGKVPNPDVADSENTILKMADKRALVAATIVATGFSDLVTQDIEDGAPAPDDAPARPSEASSAPPPASPAPRAPQPSPSGPQTVVGEALQLFERLLSGEIEGGANIAWEAISKEGWRRGQDGGPTRWLPQQPVEAQLRILARLREATGEETPDPNDQTPIPY